MMEGFSLEVQRQFFEWFFRKDYCFSRDLQSTIQGDYSFYGLGLPGFFIKEVTLKCIKHQNEGPITPCIEIIYLFHPSYPCILGRL